MLSPCPKYFLDKWEQKEGYDPVAMDKRYEFCNSTSRVVMLLLLLILFIAIALATQQSHAMQRINKTVVFSFMGATLILISVSIVLEGLADGCRAKVRRFEGKLSQVTCRLGREPKQLEALDYKSMNVLATSLLKGFGSCIKAVETVVGSGSHPAREALKALLQGYNAHFIYWDLVPDQPWEIYFQS